MLGFDNFLELERERLYECVVWDQHTLSPLDCYKYQSTCAGAVKEVVRKKN